jgi:hypothetical protein
MSHTSAETPPGEKPSYYPLGWINEKIRRIRFPPSPARITPAYLSYPIFQHRVGFKGTGFT